MNPGDLPDPRDVQRPIVYPYRFQLSRHFFLAVRDADAARKFVAGARTRITDASIHDDEVARRKIALNIGFTHAGLEALGLPEAYLRVFQEKATAFAEGPNLRAARRLADTGPSAVQWWEAPFRHRRIHIYLVAHADDAQELETFTVEVKQRGTGLDLCGDPLDGKHLTETPDRRTVHFGFRDGVANPIIKGWPEGKCINEKRHPNSEHSAGEFVLGYKTNSDFNPWLLVSPSPATAPWLLPVAPIKPEFFWNGSFGIFRKMEQDVDTFQRYVAYWARHIVPPRDEMETKERQAYVRAKICGRWDDGRVVRPGEYESPQEPAGDLDDFDFSRDRDGEGCPFGSHVRRMNPRDDPVVPTRKRPLVRRGMPYGPEFERADDQKRGLLGLFFCASLEDQFEHLLCEWGDANPMGPPNRGTSKDGFTGAHGANGVFDIPVPGETCRQLDDFRSFVTTRGTVYAFFPGMKGLELISRAPELDA